MLLTPFYINYMKSFKKISILESLVPYFFRQRSSFQLRPIFFSFLTRSLGTFILFNTL